MYISNLKIINFHSFKNIEITLPKSNILVFIGQNGCGKTTILDYIYCTNNLKNIIYFKQNRKFYYHVINSNTKKYISIFLNEVKYIPKIENFNNYLEQLTFGQKN